MEEKPSRGGGSGKSKRRCRYGADCRTDNCKFVHPSTTTDGEVVDAPVAAKKSIPNKKEKPKKDRSKIQCRYGMQCRNTKCPFFHHPAVAGPDPSSPTSASPTGVTSHPPPEAAKVVTKAKASTITNGGKIPQKSPPNFSDILKKGLIPEPSKCPPVVTIVEKSPPSPDGSNNISTKDKQSNIATPPRKATKKKKCRWGAGCRNKKCSFLHPGQKFEKEAPVVQPSPGQKGDNEADKETNGSTVPPPGIPGPANAKQMDKDKVPKPIPIIHSILPPSPEIQDPPMEGLNESFPTSLLFPTAEAQVNSMPIMDSMQQTSESIFNNIFSSMSNAPSSGFPMGEVRERMPLYGKTSSSEFSPPTMNTGASNVDIPQHAQYYQPIHEAGRENQVVNNQAPDADWLFEVLGLNDLDVNGTVPPQQNLPVVENVTEQTYANANNNVVGNGMAANINSMTMNYTPQEDHQIIQPTPIIEMSYVEAFAPNNNEVQKKPGKKLISDDEIVQSRRAALELRLESQQNGNNPGLYDLLHTCRIKQDMIKTALERSMDPASEGADTEFDETNIVSLLELNELLVGAIDMAELSMRVSAKNGIKAKKANSVKKEKAPKASHSNSVEGAKKNEDSSWKSVDKKTGSTAGKAASKPTKPAEIPTKPKKATKKPAHPSKSVNVTPSVETEKKKDDKPTSMPPPQSKPPADEPDPAVTAQEEKEKMARMLEEARNQATAARERKKSKKSKKFDRWLKQNEEEREKRAKSWSERIAKENDYVDLIQKLAVAEFIRQSKNKAMGLTTERVMSDSNALEIVTSECREAYDTIFGGLKCRIVVAGCENKDINGRIGTVRYWDREKEKFCVGLDTKKSQDNDVQYLIPEILDMTTSSRPQKTDKKSATWYEIEVDILMSYGGVALGLNFTLRKSYVIALGSAESTRVGLQAFCNARDNEERRQKMEEEAEKKREEEDGKRRARRRREENAAWERRKEQMRKDKEEYEQMKREWTRERREKGRSMFDYDDDDDDDDGECQCPRCRFGNKFSSSGGAFFFNIGGIPFRVRFDSYESDEDSFFDEFDEKWEEQLEEEKEQENIKQAGILGEFSVPKCCTDFCLANCHFIKLVVLTLPNSPQEFNRRPMHAPLSWPIERWLSSTVSTLL